MKRFLISTPSVVVLLLTAFPASAQPFTATAQAIDGDSLHVGTHEVRLFSLR